MQHHRRRAWQGQADHNSFPTPKALFHDSEGHSTPQGKAEPPGSWPRSKADNKDSLGKTLRDAAERRDFTAIERVALKLLSLSQQCDARGIAELADGGCKSMPLGRVQISRFVTSVGCA